MTLKAPTVTASGLLKWALAFFYQAAAAFFFCLRQPLPWRTNRDRSTNVACQQSSTDLKEGFSSDIVDDEVVLLSSSLFSNPLRIALFAGEKGEAELIDMRMDQRACALVHAHANRSLRLLAHLHTSGLARGAARTSMAIPDCAWICEHTNGAFRIESER